MLSTCLPPERSSTLAAVTSTRSTRPNVSTVKKTFTVEDIQKKIDELSFQKYSLEKGINWGQCRNETDKTIAVYGPKPKKPKTPYDNTLYFLGAGQETPAGWDCQGIYLANDAKVAGLNTDPNQSLDGASAIKIFKGTQLIAKSNPETSALEFNVTPSKVFKAGDINWYIPNVGEKILLLGFRMCL